MSSILKHKKLIIFIVFIAVFSMLVINRNKLSFLTAFNRNNAEYNLVQADENKIKKDDNSYIEGVTFDAYFLKDVNNDGEADGIRGSKIEYGKSEKIYFDLNVSGDYKLKNGKITFQNENVKVSGTLAKSSVIPRTISENDYRSISLSEIGPGTTSFFYLKVSPYIENDLKDYSKENKIVFSGTIVDNVTGEEYPFEKEIPYQVDIYSTKINTSIYNGTTTNRQNSAEITYTVDVAENYNSMPMKASYITGSVADFEGRHPSSVTVKSADNSDIEFNYDSTTQTFTAVKRAVLNDENVITKQAYTSKNDTVRHNKWIITVIYPTEPNEVLDNKTANISLKVWNTGYSDINLTEKKSNEVNKVLSHTFTVLPVDYIEGFEDQSEYEIGTYANSINALFVDKSFLEDVYLGQETGNFEYTEGWVLNSKTDRESALLYSESGDKLGPNQSMHDFTTYKTLTVTRVPSVSNYKLIVRNADTNEVLTIIDKDNVNEVYEFPNDVRRVSIETNKLDKGARYLAVLRFTKEIDSTQLTHDIPITTFATYGTISNSGTVAELAVSSDSTLPINGNATFSNTYSSATLYISKTNYAREIEETSIPMTYVIKHNNVDAASKLWKEGYYLIKLPQGIIDVENLSVSPNGGVVSKEVIEINGNKFIKIINSFEGSTNNADITVNFNAVVNPRQSDCSGRVELYAINNTNTLYNYSQNDIYDVNGNGSTTDKAAYSGTYISIVAPNELLTGSIIKDYDDNNSETVSPLIADIDPTKGDSDANVDVFIVNNSSFRIKNIELVGKLAYQGNKYEGLTTSVDLGSEYDVYLSGPIQIPTELEGKVTIYYTTEENPSRDINDTTNGWTTTVTDYNAIKTYMIKFDSDVEINVGNSYDFIFPIDMPTTTANLLKKTYFNHGVYFSRMTEAGTVDGKVTAPKLGVRMSRIYDVNLNVYKAFSNNKVSSGGSYILTDEDGNSQTLFLDSNGQATAKGLYVNKNYTLKQYYAPRNYIVDSEEKTFEIINQNDDSLSLEKNGTYRKIEYTSSNTLDIELDMEVLYTLDLHNIDAESGTDIKNTLFKVTGKNHESGTKITTDSSGHAYLTNMMLGEKYEIEQVRIDDYAKIDSFEVKIERDPSTHEIKILQKKTPIAELAGTCDSSTSTSYDGSNRLRVYIKNRPWTATSTCSVKIDLTNYREKYKITGQGEIYDYLSSSTNPSLKLSLVKDTPDIEINPFYTLEKTSSTNRWGSLWRNFETTKAYENKNGTWQEVDIQGGSVYYLYINDKKSYYSGDSSPYAQVNYIKATSIESDMEFVFEDDKENVKPYNNDNAYQTIKNYSVNSSDNPVLEVEVRNKYITRATLEITKVDGETNEILKGAQYKITGPGLPNKGKYLTIDENGKASVELYLSYTGTTSAVPGMTNSYPQTNYYTIEELIAPEGYSVDKKPIKFIMIADVSRNSDTGETLYNYKLNYDLSEYDTKFPSYEIDSDNKKWKVTMKDYPLVKITKVDDETGELLPNTYYVVYKIERYNGIENLEFAKDSNGEYIGEKLTIDNEEYYVVKTNENGTLTLNLPSGSYQIKEVQAADDKYEISDEIHYFGIGETVPYQAAGATLINGKALPSSAENEASNELYITDDGGYLAISLSSTSGGQLRLTKYDSEYNVEWTQRLNARYEYKNVYTYFDDPNRMEESSESYVSDSNSSYYYTYKEMDDEFYFTLGYDEIVGVNKETGEISSRSSVKNPAIYANNFVDYCDIPDGKTVDDYPSYRINPLYDDKYYCYTDSNYKYYNYFSYYDYEQHMSISDDGYVYVITKLRADGHYGMMLADGTKIMPEEIVLPESVNYSYTRYGDVYYLLKMDLDGKVYSATKLDDYVLAANKNFVDEYLPELEDKIQDYLNQYYKERLISYDGFDYATSFNIPYSFNGLNVLPNGDICFVISLDYFLYHFKASEYNYSSGSYEERNLSNSFNGNAVIRMDKDFNIKYYVPLAFNGDGLSFSYNTNHLDQTVIFNDDGSFEHSAASSIHLGVDGYNYNSYYNIISHYVYDTELSHFDPKIEEAYHNPTTGDTTNYNNGYGTYSLFKWDSNGKPENVVELFRTNRNPDNFETSNDMKRLYLVCQGYLTIAKVEDGYIVGSPITYSGLYTNTDSYRKVELASGEIIKLDDKATYVLYKVNEDSSVEWVKQYGNLYSNRYGASKVNIVDDRIVFIRRTQGLSFAENNLGSTDNDLVTSVNDPTMYHIKGDGDIVLLDFKLLDEVAPEAPEATTLNLTNRRKEYKINITNNEGGTFEVKSPEGDLLYQGNEPGTVETVKHGDDSVNIIKVKANPTYEIKEITVNGEPASYTVNDDGSVVIDNFTAVTEEKNINVTFERGMSRVVVHHYLKGTTTKIDSDELLTGRIEEPYETEAKVNRLYSLAKDDNGEIILPTNYKGKYTAEPIEVTYYYEVNMVDLRINFYKNNTTESLAQTIIEQHELGFEYFTEAAQIPHYKVVGILGNEHGTMDDDLTEVTYFYDDASTGNVIVKYVSNVTGLDIVNPVTKVIEVGSTYETAPLNPAPEGYEYVSRTDNYRGSITTPDETITVIYYYDVVKSNVITKHIDAATREEIAPRNVVEYSYGDNYTTSVPDSLKSKYRLKTTPSNANGTVYENDITVVYEYNRIKSYITVRYLDPETEKDVTPPKQVVVNLGDEYTTEPLKNVPKGYKLKETPANAKGIADSENIEVVYYYQRLRGVKDITDTGDNIIKFIIIGIVGIIGIVVTTVFIRKNKKKV